MEKKENPIFNDGKKIISYNQLNVVPSATGYSQKSSRLDARKANESRGDTLVLRAFLDVGITRGGLN